MKKISGLSCTNFVQTVVFHLDEITFLVSLKERGFWFGKIQDVEIRVFVFWWRLFGDLCEHGMSCDFASLAPKSVGSRPPVREARLVGRTGIPKGVKIRVHTCNHLEVQSLSCPILSA